MKLGPPHPTNAEAAIRASRFCSLPDGHLGPHRCDSARKEGQCNDTLNNTYRDRRPCPGCGFVAIRKVSPPSPLRPGDTEWVPRCTYCQTLGRALHYEHLARKFRQRAAELKGAREARSRRKQLKLDLNKED